MFVLSPASRRAGAPQVNRAFDRLFDESLDRVLGRTTSHPASRTPALDVNETDSAYTVVFEVPGVSRDQLKVLVEGRRVSLETIEAPVAAAHASIDADAVSNVVAPAAATQPKSASGATRGLYRERISARYARTVSLPAEVDQSASQARFENGVLTLTLAKKVPTGVTQLSIS